MQVALLARPAPAAPPPGAPAAFTRELVLLEREPEDAVLQGARELMASPFQDARLHVGVGELEAALGVGEGRSPQEALAADVVRLARAFAAQAHAPVVDVRLERIADDACRAFHRDRVRLRLITTYLGPGTQYAADADGEDALRLQAAFRGEVRTCRPGAVAWMRGADAGSGLVHRSPPISGTGVERLFLAVDAPSAVSPPRWRPCDPTLFAAASALSRA